MPTTHRQTQRTGMRALMESQPYQQLSWEESRAKSLARLSHHLLGEDTESNFRFQPLHLSPLRPRQTRSPTTLTGRSGMGEGELLYVPLWGAGCCKLLESVDGLRLCVNSSSPEKIPRPILTETYTFQRKLRGSRWRTDLPERVGLGTRIDSNRQGLGQGVPWDGPFLWTITSDLNC